MDVIPLGSGEGPLRTLLEARAGGAALRVGTVTLQPGERVPAAGVSAHDVLEVSLLLRGSLTGECGGEAFCLRAGELSRIPAGEAHWAVSGEAGAEVLWMWFGDAERLEG